MNSRARGEWRQGSDSRFNDGKGREVDRRQIAEEVLAAVGGKANVTANDICMTRLRLVTEDPSLVDTDQLSAARGVLGFVRSGDNGIEVVFGPGKAEAVHDEIARMTGVDTSDVEQGPSFLPQQSSIRVHITPARLRPAPVAPAAPASDDERSPVDELVSLLSEIEPSDADLDAEDDDDALEAPEEEDEGCGEPERRKPRVLVINGPNINMLGIREPDIYGHDSYQAMLRICHDAAQDAGFAGCTCFQSNHEGDLIDAIQDAYGTYAGIIINPGAYTHTSIAILDAAKAVGLPMIEVHISNVEEREEFRQVSYIRAACFETIMGLGVEGYRKAMFDMAEHLGL